MAKVYYALQPHRFALFSRISGEAFLLTGGNKNPSPHLHFERSVAIFLGGTAMQMAPRFGGGA